MSFLADYLSDHLTPFSDEFGRRAVRLHRNLFEGKARLRGTDEVPFSRDIFATLTGDL